MTTTVYLDFAKETTPIVIFAKQNDSDRTLNVYPLINGLAPEYENGTTGELHLRRSDGTEATISATSHIGRETYFSIDLTADALSVAGMIEADFSTTYSGMRTTSQSFYINVRETFAASQDNSNTEMS